MEEELSGIVSCGKVDGLTSGLRVCPPLPSIYVGLPASAKLGSFVLRLPDPVPRVYSQRGNAVMSQLDAPFLPLADDNRLTSARPFRCFIYTFRMTISVHARSRRDSRGSGGGRYR